MFQTTDCLVLFLNGAYILFEIKTVVLVGGCLCVNYIFLQVSVPVVKIDDVNVDEAVNCDNKWDKYIRIPAGTSLAFDLTPLAITQDGCLSLVFDSSKRSGFDTIDGLICMPKGWCRAEL